MVDNPLDTSRPGVDRDLYIKWTGGKNVTSSLGIPWPVVSPEWVAAQNPDIIIKCVSPPQSGWKGDAERRMIKDESVPLSMDAAPEITTGRVMLPYRFVAQALGLKVDWDSENQRVTIS